MEATQSFKQPGGLFLLFFVEMWERFSYYGMRAILILYLTSTLAEGGLAWGTEQAGRFYGWYTGLIYMTPLIGGFLADRWLGTRKAVVIGGAVIACGHFAMATQNMTLFYAGLLLIISGTGLFKPNISTMVGQLYGQDDHRRDAGFTIFYMGINLGALIGTLICGYLGESPDWGWHYGFGAAGVGMVLGLVSFLILRDRYLPGIGLPLRSQSLGNPTDDAQHRKLTPEERDRMLSILIVSFFVIFFWCAFEQAGSSLNLFAKHSTERTVFNFEMPASWFQAMNSFFIIILGPLFAVFWTGLARRNQEPSSSMKIGIGLVVLAVGFVFMVGAGSRADTGQLVSPMWLIAVYFLHTAGELCLSPVGLSLVTKVAPVKYMSFLMGAWFLAVAIANLVGGYLAGAVKKISSGAYFSILGGQADFYLIFVVMAGGAGIVMMMATPWLGRLMHGRDT